MRIKSFLAFGVMALTALLWFLRCSSPSGSSIPTKFYPIFPAVTVQCGTVGCIQ